jgi:effector-binding domain-containing protein
MAQEVMLRSATAVPTAVVAASTSWPEFPGLWRSLLDEVWACLHAAGITRGCPNDMLYLDDDPHVEVGVVLPAPAPPPPLTGRVVGSALPAGRVATTVHHGPYDGLGATHREVARWCAAHGHRPAGPRWEIYGPHREDPADIEVEVSYLLT